MKLKWVNGRQGGEYQKLKLFEFLNNDCYLIKYSPNYEMPEHKDPVENKKHFRLNIVLYGTAKFKCEKTIVNLFNKIIIFRPDKYKHSIKNGPKKRLVLSIGATF